MMEIDNELSLSIPEIPEFFTVVVSNPPYSIPQAEDNGSVAIYHSFMTVAKSFGNLVSMVYPFKWTISGKGEGLVEFREEELGSRHYTTFIVHPDESALFGTISIKGGTNIFLWSRTPRDAGSQMLYQYNNDKLLLDTLVNSEGVFVPNPRVYAIIDSVNTVNSLRNQVSTVFPYGRNNDTSLTRKNMHKLSEGSGLFMYIAGGDKVEVPITITDRDTDDFKVFASRSADPSGDSMRRIGRVMVGSPGELCSSPFLKIGSFLTEREAVNCVRYVRTDFVTFLIGVITPTQHALRRVYSLVPNVDFITGEILDRPGTLLDFSKPESLDNQLAEIYELSEDDKKLIAGSIKPWQDKLSVSAGDNK